MADASILCAEITRAEMLVTVDGIIINKRMGKKMSKQGGKAAFNFTIKDIICDTVNVVLWDKPEELLKINLTLRLGSAFRFLSLKSTSPSRRSQELSPRTTCPFVLKMTRWSVERLDTRTEEQLTEKFNNPPRNPNPTPIPKLLSASSSSHVNLMGVVIFKGEPRKVVLLNGETSVALEMEVADSSRQSILVTLWGAELTAFISEQIIQWDSVIYLQDAVLKACPNRSNYVTTNARTLVIPNSTGKEAILIQRDIGRARTNGLQARKINEVPKTSPVYSPDFPPQWITLKVICDFFREGTWRGESDPYKPMASILLLSNVVSIVCRIVCPKCETVARNDSVCEACGFHLGSDSNQASIRANFADSNGGVVFQLNHTDLDHVLSQGGLPRGTIEEITLSNLLQKQLFRRFVLVFQILDFHMEDRTLYLKTIKIRRPTLEDWAAYFKVALS